MQRTKRWRLALGAALASIALVGAACSGDDSAEPAGSAGSAGGAAQEATPFGSACSQIPTSGSGSFESMMTAPVATAAAENPLLSSLVHDLEAAGLTDTLNNADGLTVFAPTNMAFKAAAKADPEGTEAMMADPTGAFAQLLTYHVVEGQIPPDQLAGMHTTLQGQSLKVVGGGEDFTINGMTHIVCGDVHTDNATVYIIDEVLHPPA
jgi:uncharacterized surface protein with fasciclin (FAS1) repeats